MPTERDETLAESAGRIADGRGADWDAALRDTPDLARERASLGRVAAIAEAWRTLGATPPEDEPREPALFYWGELEALEKLGEGGFGEVWRAWDPSLEREVALKLRRAGAAEDEHARRELAEARRMARVHHANILAIHGVDVRDGRAGLWTELVRGRTLERLLAERGAFGAEEATLVGLDLCRALAAVHRAGLVHGDLKASNVMREDGGRIVLMDFGSVSEQSGEGSSRTGTPLAAAPETLRGEAPTPAADLYSLGALLYRLVTTQHVVPAGSLAELQAKHARGERGSLRAARPDLPSAFVTAVERALGSTPAERYADAGAFERALAAALPSGAAVPAAVTPKPRRFPWLAAAAALVAIAALAWWALARSPIVPVSPAGAVPPLAGVARESPAPANPQPATLVSPPRAEAVLWRVRDHERTPLVDGAAIAPGDHLYLDYRADEALHVYVLDEDERGETYTLFPVAGGSLANPLRAGGTLRLPGERAGVPFDWVTTSSGGREHVLVVASRRRVAALEQLVAAIPAADPAHAVAYARVDDGALLALRGIGGMAPAAPSAERGGKLAALARLLAARPDAGVWVRELELENH